MINGTQKFDLAGMVVFGLLGIGAIVGVCCGAKHQWFMFAICVIMFIALWAEYRKENTQK